MPAHDGNVYQHTDSGWSKCNNGGWTPVQPPKNPGNNQSGNRPTGSNGPGSAQARNQRNSMDSSSFRQLQQDRLGREAGGGGLQGRSSGAGGGRLLRR